MTEEWRNGEYLISTDPDRLDLTLIHQYLANESYWATGRSLESVRRSVSNSLPFGMYRGTAQIGFARVVTDYVSMAWLGDVFVLPEYQGRGLGKWLIGVIVAYPRFEGVRRWILATRDAHGLYAQFGFTPLDDPARFMERFTNVR
jgi:GNAT superfamily N-acetyltransferase